MMSDISRFSPLWGSWYIGELIGKGSFGEVYKCEKHEYGNTYVSAVKHISIPQEGMTDARIIHEGYATDYASVQSYYSKLRDEIINEITICYKLRGNSNIVSYEDHVIFEKTDSKGYDIFIRMELLTGLPEYTKDRRLTEEEVIKMGSDLCSALELLDSRHILHRDIKPANIFVNDEGTFKLGDFGESKVLRETKSSMSVRGTFAYMSPEISRGGKADISADIYSLGIVMYRELNAHKPPFVRPDDILTLDLSNSSDQRRFMGEILPRPALCRNDDLWSIISTATSFDPAVRFRTPSAMKASLDILKKNGKNNSSPVSYNTVNNYNPSGEQAFSSYNNNAVTDETVSAYNTGNYSYDQNQDIMPIQGVNPYNPKNSGGRAAVTNVKSSTENKSMKIIIILLSVILVLVLGGIMIIVFNQGKTTPENDTSRIERYVGKNFDDVKTELENEGYKVHVRYSQSDNIPEGEVIMQSPDENEEIKQGDIIILTVSSGSKNIIGDYTDMGFDEAKAKLELLGLVVGEPEYETSDKAANTVIGQSIPAGTDVKAGTVIILTLSSKTAASSNTSVSSSAESSAPESKAESSKAAESFKLTDYTESYTYDKAKSELTSLGITVENPQYEFSDQPEGMIIKQTPAAGTLVKKGTKVVFTVSKGQDQRVEVPSCVGMSVTEASNLLSQRGLTADLQKTYDLEVAADQVIKQSVAGGTKVKSGSTVTITFCDGAGFTGVPSGCTQLLYLKCSGSSGTMRLYNLVNGRWVYQSFKADAAIGINGVSSINNYDIEGYHTPGGCFPIGRELTTANTSYDTVIVEDTRSPYYNCIVPSSVVGGQGDYDDVGRRLASGENCGLLFIEHNGDGTTKGVPNKGSSITICGCNNTVKATGGCIDIWASDYYALRNSLDYSRNPYIFIE